MLSGMVPAPHAMVPGTTDTDYYLGKVTGSVAAQSAEAEARRVARETSPAVPEVNGRGGLEPVRYGDWEKAGICVDF